MKKLGKMSKASRNSYITYALVIVCYAVVKIMLSGGNVSSSMKGMLVPITCYVIMAISLNLTVGILGELSLGHAGFMSIGAFMGTTVAMILKTNDVPDVVRLIVAIVVGTIFAGIFGFLIGIPVLRLKGDYLAIVTLAFGEIIKSLLNNFYVGYDSNGIHLAFVNNDISLAEGGKMILQGALGMKNITRISTFDAGIILIIVALFITFNFVSSRIGRCIMAIRDNRIAAESVGIEITKYKMTAFVISAAIAGAAGALYGLNYSTLMPSKFGFNQSILILVFVVLGGQGNMLGSVVSAALLTILPEALREFADYRMLVYAIVLILFMLISHNPKVSNLIFTFKKNLAAKRNAKAGKEVTDADK